MHFDRPSRTTLALIGFLLHAPGIRLLTGLALSPSVLRLNLIAGGATVVVTILAALTWSDARLLVSVLAWTTGHVIWSTILAVLVLKGRAFASAPEPGTQRFST